MLLILRRWAFSLTCLCAPEPPFALPPAYVLSRLFLAHLLPLLAPSRLFDFVSHKQLRRRVNLLDARVTDKYFTHFELAIHKEIPTDILRQQPTLSLAARADAIYAN